MTNSVKENVLRLHQNCIDFAEAEVAELRERLDERLTELGDMRKKKWEFENNANSR